MKTPSFSEDWSWYIRHLYPRIVLPLLKNVPTIFWLEIGSFEGRSALWTVENMFHNKQSSRITCIDRWQPWDYYKGSRNFDYERTFDLNTAGVEQIVKLKGESTDILPLLPKNSFHGVLIDSSHLEQETLQEARLVLPLLTSPGIMVFDDYLWPEGDSVKRAVDAFLEESKDRVKSIHQSYQAICQLTP